MASVATMTAFERNPEGDGWVLRPEDGGTWLTFDYAVTVSILDGYAFRIEVAFSFAEGNGNESLMDPEGDPVHLGPVLHVNRTTLLEARAFDSGRLELSFGNGVSIGVPSDIRFEAWNAVGPDGFLMVALPGGGLSVWE